MPAVTNVSWNYSEADYRLRVILTLDTMPSSSVYKSSYITLNDPREYNWYPSWTQNDTQKTITFDFDWWGPIASSLDSVSFEFPYETLAKSLKIKIKNQNGTPVVESQTENQMYRLDFGQFPFDGEYYFDRPSGVFFSDGSAGDFSESLYLLVYYPSNVVNAFIDPSKTPQKFSIVKNEKQLIFQPEENSSNRFRITDILDPQSLIIDLNQNIDFENPSFYSYAYQLNDKNEEIDSELYIGLYEQLGYGLIEQLEPNKIKFYYWGNYSDISDILLFVFDNNEFIKYEKINGTYTLISHTGPQYKQYLPISPDNGYVWDSENPISLTLYKRNGESVSGYLSEDNTDEFGVEIYDTQIYWTYYEPGEYYEISFVIPAHGNEPEQIITYIDKNGEYVLKDDEPVPEETPVWDAKNKDGSELPHTTSNYIIDGNTAIIIIRSETPISADFLWWRYPETGFEEDIIYKTPTSIQMDENNTKAVLKITPYPKGEFYIENGDFTKLYKFFDLDEQNIDIQFSKERIQIIANQLKYFFKSSTPTLKLYKIIDGKAEVVPTVMYTGSHNSTKWVNSLGQTVDLGTTNFDFDLWGVYEGKEFTPGYYKFVFTNMEFLKPYTMKKGFKDIMYYGPNGIADGYYTGDEFYEIAEF